MPILLAEDAMSGSWQYAIAANFALIVGLVYKVGGTVTEHKRMELDRREMVKELAALKAELVETRHNLAQILTTQGLQLAVLQNDVDRLQLRVDRL